MSLCSESQMIEILGCSKAQFDDYLSANVFAPVIANKGKRRADKMKGAVYESDAVQKEVADFEARKFSPAAIPLFGLDLPANNGHSDNQNAGKVLRLDGINPHLNDGQAETFDYAGILGPMENYKQVRAAMIKIASRGDIPFKIKKDVATLFKTFREERRDRQANRRKVPIEKYEADTQKIHEIWATAWSGENGVEAAQLIVEKIEQLTGKSLRKEFADIVKTVHRQIVDVSNRVVQPSVVKLLEKL